MKVYTKPFGTTEDGKAVTAYTLENENGMRVVVLDYGCTIQSILVPDKNGKPVDVVLGYDTVAEYEQNGGYMGACLGRVANRIGNASFVLNGKTYELAKNDGDNHLHGGLKGFHCYVWNAQTAGHGVSFTRTSPDGEEGYPGNLRVQIVFVLDDENRLHIRYSAVCDSDTLLNMTNHSYFNLAGGGSVLEHLLTVEADSFCENDAGCLPTGQILPVEGTPFDFRTEKAVGRDIEQDDVQLHYGGGYDHNYCLCTTPGIHPAARLVCPQTGIALQVSTSLPGMQLYSSNSLTPRRGKGGQPMGLRSALCMETQIWPDAVHHENFPSVVLKKRETFSSDTIFAFSTVSPQ